MKATCAKVIPNTSTARYAESYTWCGKPASFATVCDANLPTVHVHAGETAEHYDLLNVVHFYCAEHAHMEHMEHCAVVAIPQLA